jgi:glycosyltransferase involved in cell wall biosynthesis
MKILVANWTRRRVGGAETYLGRVMPLLGGRGHALACAFEADEPAGRPPLELPPQTLVVPLTAGDAFERIRSWNPDVIYVHGLLDPDRERRLLDIAPAVLFAHGYYGTCISGQKTHRFPVIQTCDRVFGAACLALFYPRRCGGINPLTMAREYAQQAARNALLPRYAAVVTLSEHMSREFTRHRAAGGRVFPTGFLRPDAGIVERPSRRLESRVPSDPWRLVFVGRMDELKGGMHLIDALPKTQAAIGHALELTFAGDGPRRGEWERRARELASAHPSLAVRFTGWLQKDDVIALLDRADILVVPSLWPEPYGLVGVEAARRGVPAVAFDNGGIREWLTDGVNGCLAPGGRPTPEGLAEALIRCLRSLGTSDALRLGALSGVKHADDNRHVDGLVTILEGAASRRGVAASDAAS